MQALAEEGKQTAMDLAKINAWFFPLMLLLIGASNIIVMYVGGRMYIDGSIDSVGLIAEFILYVNMLTWPVTVVGWLTSIIQRAEVSQERINDFLQIQPEINDHLADTQLPIQGQVEFNNVSYKYPDTGIQALKNVNLKIRSGETVALMGKTGAGKSTVIDLITRLIEPQEGTVLIDGISINNYYLTELRTSMGVVPQDSFLFSDTIENNIRFGKLNATEEEIENAARLADVHQNILDFPKGYQTLLGERGISLSGGQKQRVSIARAMIKEPQIFLFDDCLSAVDTETEEVILGNIKNQSKEKTTLIVSHRMATVKHADRILVLDEGQIVQEGTHNELISSPGFYQDLYQEQLNG
jgi:ATP-binding cassette subfamily B protein